MMPSPLTIRRLPQKFVSDDKRVITRFMDFGDGHRMTSILSRLLWLDEEQVKSELDEVLEDFGARHRDIKSSLWQNWLKVSQYLTSPPESAEDLRVPSDMSEQKKLLIGAYFTLEYSIESAALFNPSIVPHPDQEDVANGSVRFLMSLRATGEGHISSIVFRRGVFNTNGRITFDPPPRYAFTAKPIPDMLYKKELFFRRLLEIGDWEELARPVLDPLPEWFTKAQLEESIAAAQPPADKPKTFEETINDMRWLAEANYELRFPADSYPAETVIFPATLVESRGMEDLRLVAFQHDDGTRTYYGTYTAWDGKRMLPMILETAEFKNFHVRTLNGPYARNKGMALFPRKVNGKFMMIARHDGEKLYLLQSDEVHFWHESKLLQKPVEPWELTQIGNCGSPIETPEGWILLTHGVGPMRRYCIGAMLLDLDDPLKVLGRLRYPLIVPDEQEREGYVPNVVYSCGSMICGDQLVIPYAMSDLATAFATIPVRTLLTRLLEVGP